MLTKLHSLPISVGAAAVYPYNPNIIEACARTAKYDETKFNLCAVVGDQFNKRVWVPRNMAPSIPVDNRVAGLSCTFKSSFKPRNDEQTRCIAECVARLRKGESFIFQAPTGMGKTWCSADIIAKIGKKTLIIVTKEDILDQWVAAFEAILGLKLGVGIGVIKGDKCDVAGRSVVIAMVQSIAKDGRYPEGTFRDFGLMVCDEVHRMGADFFSQACFQVPALLRLGMSVGPDSIVELKGGLFGRGWVGPIAEATRLVAQSIPAEIQGGVSIHRTQTSGILSRGWTGTKFAWKPVKSFIQHACDQPCLDFQVGGDTLQLTVDHSVFRVEGLGYTSVQNNLKPCASLFARASSDLKVGDTLAYDTGASWGGQGACDYSVLGTLAALPCRGNFHVAVALGGTTRKALGLSPKRWWACVNSSSRGHHRLPFDTYWEHKDKLPAPTSVYSEGSQAALPPTFDLCQWAYLLGFYLGDGWVDGSRVAFAVETARVSEFVARLGSIFGAYSVSVMVRPTRADSSEVKLGSVILTHVFKDLFKGAKCYDKSIPADWIVAWPEGARRQLFHGLMDSDGSLALTGSDKRRYCYCTTSLALARGVVSLARSLGVTASINTRAPSHGGVIHGRQITALRPSYQVHMSEYAIRGENKGYRGLRSKFVHDGLEFLEAPVRRISKVEVPPAYVYDLEMEGHPSFTANGILVHNSATPRRKDGREEVLEAHIGPVSVRSVVPPMVPRIIRQESPWCVPQRRKLNAIGQVVMDEWGEIQMAQIPHSPGKCGHIINMICEHHGRNKLITNFVAQSYKAGRKIIVQSDRKEHLVTLMSLASSQGVPQYHMTLYVGGLNKAQREEAKEGMVIFGTFAMMAEATDIPDADTLVMASPKSDVEQIVGRVLRFVPDKKEPVVFDIVDSSSSVMAGYAANRLRWYASMGINVKKVG